MNNASHRHTFYEILYITSGVGNHIVDFKSYKLKPPMFYFISPGQVHFWDLTLPIEGLTLIFSEDFLVFPSSGLNAIEELTFFHTVGDLPELFLQEKQFRKIDELLKLIESEYQTKNINRASVLRAFLHIFITQLQRLVHNINGENKVTSQSSLVRRFKHLATKNLKGLSVQEYAERMGVSSSHLSNIVKSLTGYTPAQIIHNEIILEAKRLLVHTELTISEIGFKLGFEDPSYFSRFFLREAGLRPQQFRNQIREKYHLFQG